MHNRSGYYDALLEISANAAEAISSIGKFKSTSLRATIKRRISVSPGEKESLIATPIYELAKVWAPANKNFGELAGKLLSNSLVSALNDAKTNKMPKGRYPYLHQLQAWESAKSSDKSAYMVTSGTGSGKTECFMVPILDDLIRESETKGRLTGVRALMLYPLNALIESQEERLSSWIEPFAGDLKYAMYNGETPENPRQVKRQIPGRLGDRKTIRATPPSILVTNITMLEYMLIRNADQSMLEKSQGTLRWIVLDEAHSYIGAQSAEMALLLRRVRQAFGVLPSQVRLVATSATIGEGEETKSALRKFVADLAGISEDRVDVIEGLESHPELSENILNNHIDIDDLAKTSEADLWNKLSQNSTARKVRNELSKTGQSLDEIAHLAFPNTEQLAAKNKAIEFLDIAANAKPNSDSPHSFLAWRMHSFHRAQAGIWSCINPKCAHKSEELLGDDTDWKFGEVYLFQRDKCSCGSPVFEICTCTNCGTAWLEAEDVILPEDKSRALRQIKRKQEFDEFSLDAEPDEEDDEYAIGRVLLGEKSANPNNKFISLEDGKVSDNHFEDDGYAEFHIVQDRSQRKCCASKKKNELSKLRFGAPFLLGNAIPTLLNQIEGKKSANYLPNDGRQLLSFTDSRQGTARFAAKLQQESERNLVRSIVLHKLQSSNFSQSEIMAIDEKIKKFKAIGNDLLNDEIDDLKQQRATLIKGKPISWKGMISTIAKHAAFEINAGSNVSSIGASWLSRMDDGRMMASNPEVLAEMLLSTEFFRRPVRGNNAETLGIAKLTFPDLEKKAAFTMPSLFAEKGNTVSNWVGMHLLAIDLVFRNNWAIDLDKEPIKFEHWVSPRRGLRSVKGPDTVIDEEIQVGRLINWPRAKTKSSRFVQAIMKSIKGDWDNDSDVEIAQEFINCIWENLRTTGAIIDVGEGKWRQSFKKVYLSKISSAWLCTETSRLLNYNPSNFSPFDPKSKKPLREISLPNLQSANPGGVTDQTRREIIDWCATDPTVLELRRFGVWNNINTRVYCFNPYFRSQEHSAQIDRASLRTYEDQFKAGQINVLNCSTTMEMGVDIPNVGAVVNTNVPPSISNYRQRVGRAGRRNEAWAMAFTFCKDNPLDWLTFKNPKLLLNAKIAAPKVKLDSPIIVLRHVNSMLLGIYTRDKGGQSIQKNIGSFFGATGQIYNSLSEHSNYLEFLKALSSDWGKSKLVQESIKSLVRGTILEGNKSLLKKSASSLKEVFIGWKAEYDLLLATMELAEQKSAQFNFCEKQLKRLTDQYLISELAKRNFTPAYGFPVDVVSFRHQDTYGKQGKNGNQYPSRKLDIAIRDYAPGSEIVINGLVHKSAGILPSWSNRMDSSAFEDIKTLWSCNRCAAYGVDAQEIATCPSCGNATEKKEILKPSGFLADINASGKPHTAFERISWVPPQRPEVAIDETNWVYLPDPSVGAMRVSRVGRVLNTSAGQSQEGFCVCIACGRSAEMEFYDGVSVIPKSMLEHYPLMQPKHLKRDDGRCSGTEVHSNLIRKNVFLGHEVKTDVFELQLVNLDANESNLKIALSVGAALREVLAKWIGVDAAEMGLTASPSLRLDSSRCVSFKVYDKSSGGSGFSVQLGDQGLLVNLLKQSVSLLECDRCITGCPECILQSDLQYDEQKLNRTAALEYLKKNFLPAVSIKKENQIFGPETHTISENVSDYLLRQINSARVSRLTIYFHGDPQEWDFVNLAELPLFQDGANASDVDIVFVMDTKAVNTLFFSQKQDLIRLVSSCSGDLFIAKGLGKERKEHIIASVSLPSGERQLASFSEQPAVPGSSWGARLEDEIYVGYSSEIDCGNKISLDRLASYKEGNSIASEFNAELNCEVSEFGRRFWLKISNLRPQDFGSERELTSIKYSDRYIKSPLTAKLLMEVVKATPGKSSNTKVSLVTAKSDLRSQLPLKLLHHNWSSDHDREIVLASLLKTTDIEVKGNNECEHARFFELEWNDQRKIKIYLDQGFGAWVSGGHRPIPFDGSRQASQQIRELENISFDVCLSNKVKSGSSFWIKYN